MSELRGRLWQRELLSRLAEAGRDDVDEREWLSELKAEEDAAQDEFRNLGVVFAQLSQVEAGVRSLSRAQRPLSVSDAADSSTGAGVTTKERPTFDDNIKTLRSCFMRRFVKELKALDDVRHLRNHLAHGEVRVGVASLGSGAPLEPVIAFVFSEKGLPENVHEADPLRGVVEGDLDVYRAMEIASEGLDALITIMLEMGFSPFASPPAP